MKRAWLLTAFTTVYTLTLAQSSDLNAHEKSVRWTIDEVLDIISAKEGEPRDLEALRNLFLPNCQFMVVNTEPEAESPVEALDRDDFIELLKDPYYEAGYYETSIGEIIEVYGSMAHAWQAFYGKDSEGEEATGINSIQLVYFQDQWRIISMLWAVSSESTPLPKKYIQRAVK